MDIFNCLVRYCSIKVSEDSSTYPIFFDHSSLCRDLIVVRRGSAHTGRYKHCFETNGKSKQHANLNGSGYVQS